MKKSIVIKNLSRIIVFIVGISMMAMSLTAFASEEPAFLPGTGEYELAGEYEPVGGESTGEYGLTGGVQAPAATGGYEPIQTFTEPPEAAANVELTKQFIAYRRISGFNLANAHGWHHFEPHPDRAPGEILPGDYVRVIFRFDTHDTDNELGHYTATMREWEWHLNTRWSGITPDGDTLPLAAFWPWFNTGVLHRGNFSPVFDLNPPSITPTPVNYYFWSRNHRIGFSDQYFHIRYRQFEPPGYRGPFYYHVMLKMPADAPIGTTLNVTTSVNLYRITLPSTQNERFENVVPPVTIPIPIGNLCDTCEYYPCKCCEVCEYYPCKCCEVCEYYPCKCCEVCEYYPCKCCEVCIDYPCKCCEVCRRYPSICRDPVPGPNRDALREAKRNANAIERGRHTTTTWNAFIAALERAQAVYANPNATQAEIDVAKQDLLTAKGALVKYPTNNQNNITADTSPRTGDMASALPLLAGFLLSMSSVLGGTSLRRKLKK